MPTSSSSQPVTAGDGDLASLGRSTDAEATAEGSLIAIAKRLRTLLAGTLSVAFSAAQHVIVDSLAQLPAALDGLGFLKVHEQGTATVSVSNTSLVSRIHDGLAALEVSVNQNAAFDGTGDAFYVLHSLAFPVGFVGPATPGSGKWDRVRVAKVHNNLARAAFTAGQTKTIWTPAAGLAPRLLWFSVTVSAATVVTIKIGTRVVWERDFAAAGGEVVLLAVNGTIGVANDLVTMTSSAAVTGGAATEGTEE